jgi:hypothetical protein
MSANRYLPAAENVARLMPAILAEQGLKPLINGFVLTETEQGHAWLFVVLDDSLSDDLGTYAAPRVLSRLSMALHGHRVMFSHANGLRYAILLGSPD